MSGNDGYTHTTRLARHDKHRYTATVPGTVTITKPQLETQSTSTPERGWKVILFNDDWTPFDLVIFGLQRAAGLSLEVAEMVAVEAHQEGEAIVKRGLSSDDAQIICAGLRKWTILEGVTPGVRCEAQRDEG